MDPQQKGEIDLSADILIMRIMEVFLADKVLDPENMEAISPIGALLGVMPWNFLSTKLALLASW
jgi:hypothetical protein